MEEDFDPLLILKTAYRKRLAVKDHTSLEPSQYVKVRKYKLLFFLKLMEFKICVKLILIPD